jgi:hypothetical protein
VWLSDTVCYKKTKIFKYTRFGKRVKIGYELTEPLVYKYRDMILELPSGYVFDGPSYRGFFERWLGDRRSPSLMASSAMHDIMNNFPIDNGTRYIQFSIRAAAKLYITMIRKFPHPEKPTNIGLKIQYIGLLIFHPLYRFIMTQSNWQKLQKST